jgi:D-beta-D-heptose 7-phosphate kinase/D-beta-D-heptose 1-phosphate adenosyltransferase
MKLPEIDPERPPRALVIGDLMIDRYLWGTCERISPEAPVQVVDVRRESYALGGAGNVIANLASLGAQVNLIALVGHDWTQSPLASLLAERGLTTSGLVRDDQRPTTVKTRLIAAHHQIVRFDTESTVPCPETCALAIVERAAQMIPDTQVVILSDYGKGLLTEGVVQALIKQCHRYGVPVLVDPKGRDFNKYRGASLLTPNRREAALASGLTLDSEQGIRRAGQKLRSDYGLEACLITLSEDGMALFAHAEEHWLPTEAQEVFDVTGAGDTVIAAVGFGLAAGLSLVEACRFSNRAAGVVVGKVGSASVTLDEIRAPKGTLLPPQAKIVELEVLLEHVALLRSLGRKIVFTNGCFDLLHSGHVQYLTQAAALGAVLIVGLNSDASVRRIKGMNRPINDQNDRAIVLGGLSAVTYVVLFSEDTPLSLIQSISPDVLAKGGDYDPQQIIGADVVRAAGGTVTVIPFVAGKSTTALIERASGSKS